MREFPFSSAWILKNQFFLCAVLSWDFPHRNSLSALRRQVKTSARASDPPERLFGVRTCTSLFHSLFADSSLCLENWHMSDLIDTITLHFCWVQYSAALFSCWGAALYCATYSLSHGRRLHWCAEYPLKDWQWFLKVLTSGLWFVVFCPWASLSNFPQINTIAVHFFSKWAHSTQVMLTQNLLPAPVV